MRVVERRSRGWTAPQPRDLGGERGVIGLEIEPPPLGDLCVVGRFALAIERLAVEGRRRAELGRRLAGIERRAGRIAVDVDERARQRRADDRRAERARRNRRAAGSTSRRRLPRQPGATKRGLAAVELGSGVGNADDQRRVAALDRQPVGRGAHRLAPSSAGSGVAPTAATIAPPRTSAVAAAMSGCR